MTRKTKSLSETRNTNYILKCMAVLDAPATSIFANGAIRKTHRHPIISGFYQEKVNA